MQTTPVEARRALVLYEAWLHSFAGEPEGQDYPQVLPSIDLLNPNARER